MVNTDLLKQILPDNLKEKCFDYKEYVDKGNIHSGVNTKWFSCIVNLLSILRLCGTSKKRLLKFDSYAEDNCKEYIGCKNRLITAHNDYFSVTINSYPHDEPFRYLTITFYRNDGTKFLQLENNHKSTYCSDERKPFFLFDFEDVKALLEDAYDSGTDYGNYILCQFWLDRFKGIYNPVKIIKEED